MMITCVVEYTIDAAKTEAFERFARAWIGLVDRHGLSISGMAVGSLIIALTPPFATIGYAAGPN